MPSLLVLSEREIRECVGADQRALAAVEEGFTRLARGDVIVPAPMGIDVPERGGEIHIKTAYVRGLDCFAVKIASGFTGNAALGLPGASGMMVLCSAETGHPQALLLDNGYLTDLRTGIAGAIAAKYLAREKIGTVGVVGTGIQARFQLRALRLVRQFRRVLVYGRTPESVRKYVAEMSPELRVEVIPVGSISELVRQSDVVVTTTASRAPLVMADDLHEGLHITAVGSDGPGKQELDPKVLARADRLVCDLKSQCFRLGELQHGLGAGTINERSEIAELGDLTTGRKPGRTNDREITVCDLTGVGVQDTAIAVFADREARQRSLGNSVNT